MRFLAVFAGVDIARFNPHDFEINKISLVDIFSMRKIVAKAKNFNKIVGKLKKKNFIFYLRVLRFFDQHFFLHFNLNCFVSRLSVQHYFFFNLSILSHFQTRETKKKLYFIINFSTRIKFSEKVHFYFIHRNALIKLEQILQKAKKLF